MSITSFYPAAQWQKRLAAAGIEHDLMGQLPLVHLDNGESIWLRLLPPEFARHLDEEKGDWGFLPLAYHVWQNLRTVCPALTHRGLLNGCQKESPPCPCCEKEVPLKKSGLVFGVTRGGTVLLTVSDMILMEELIDSNAFDLDKGRWIEFYRRNWNLHMRYGQPEPIDREQFDQAMDMANLFARPRQPNYGLLEQMAQALVGWLKAGQPRPEPGRIRLLKSILPHETLVAPTWGMKSPHDQGWQNTSYRMMEDPEYLELLDKNNIGLLCGKDDEAVSKGARPDLITIGLDADDDNFADIVLDCNPQLEKTFTAWGARAPKWFFHVPGDKKKLLETTKIYQRRGDKHVEVGSWLSSGAQGVIDGLHPSGCFYRHNGLPLITVETLKLPRNIYFGTALADFTKKRRRGHHWSEGRILDLHKLENVHKNGKGHEARCPACARQGKDRAGDNLLIYEDGRFKCSAMIDATDQENHRHNQEIWREAGPKESAHE